MPVLDGQKRLPERDVVSMACTIVPPRAFAPQIDLLAVAEIDVGVEGQGRPGRSIRASEGPARAILEDGRGEAPRRTACCAEHSAGVATEPPCPRIASPPKSSAEDSDHNAPARVTGGGPGGACPRMPRQTAPSQSSPPMPGEQHARRSAVTDHGRASGVDGRPREDVPGFRNRARSPRRENCPAPRPARVLKRSAGTAGSRDHQVEKTDVRHRGPGC